MKILFLDDDPIRAGAFLANHPKATWVQTAQKCIQLLNEDWNIVSLDHDLEGEIFVDSNRKDCGMEVVRQIIRLRPEPLKDTTFIVHSYNRRAALAMTAALSLAGYKSIYQPFDPAPQYGG